ncbi:MAG: rhombosortase [Nitrospirae bacterium]|nr:rhombosortase [Nitrospirota bacterium]
MAEEKSIDLYLPFFTMMVLALCIIGSIMPGITSVLIYDRTAISEGELWRIVTSHFVHFNYIHLFYNLLVFGIAGWIIERRGYNHFKLLCVLSATFIGITLFIFQPGMMYYGGLSGVACGAIYYSALFGLREPTPWRNICLCIIVALPIKIALEIYYNSSLLPYGEKQTFVLIPISHLAGSIAAFLLFLAVRNKGIANQNVLKYLDTKNKLERA